MNSRMFLPGWARRVRVIGFSLAGSLLLATGAGAVTFTVNTTDDGVDVSPGDGNCSTTPTLPYICTLRAAVMEANRAHNGATIILPASVTPYTLKISPDIADGEATGDLNLLIPSGYAPGPTTITGAGAATTVIDANGIDRILRIDAGRSLTISGVSLVNGLLTVSSDGGGIVNSGSLVLNDCIVSHNVAIVGSSSGGAIKNVGVLQATNVTFNDNHAGGLGGAIQNLSPGSLNLSQSTLSANTASDGGGIAQSSSGASTVNFSTFADNTANSDGGGIYVDNGKSLTMTTSTVSGNNAGSGGGVYNGGPLYVSNSTISGNSATKDGGGFYNNLSGTSNIYNSTIVFNQADFDGDNVGQGGGVFTEGSSVFNVRNTVLAENHRKSGVFGSDCYGTVGSYGNNRFSDATNCTITQQGNFYTVQPSSTELGPLQNNGGPTQTHALVPPSSMIGGGLGCIDQNSIHLSTDQRGKPRPPSPPVAANSICDLGAFEYNEIFPAGFELP